MHLNKLYIRRVLLSGCLISVCILGFLYWASSDIDSGVYVNCLCYGSDTKRCVTLTFDDGPNEEMTPKILDILMHNGAIILLHNRCRGADELLQMLIEEIKAQNYGIINIDEMLGVDPYKMDI